MKGIFWCIAITRKQAVLWLGFALSHGSITTGHTYEHSAQESIRPVTIFVHIPSAKSAHPNK